MQLCCTAGKVDSHPALTRVLWPTVLSSHCRSCVGGDIVEWVRQQAALLPRVPSLAFVHIPIPQFSEAWSSGAPANGTKGEETGCPLDDTGLFEVAK